MSSFFTITPRVPFGSLLKQPKGAKPKKVGKTLGRNPREFSDSYLEAVRKCPCVACGADPCGEAAHVRMTVQGRPNPGMQQKPDDKCSVPLCRRCHTEQHSGSEAKFWKRLKIKPLMVAAELAACFPDLEKMRAVVFRVRAAVNLGRKA